jgi:hypothetical protein
MLAALIRWIAGEQQEMIEYLRAENLVLKEQLRGRPVRLPDHTTVTFVCGTFATRGLRGAI